MEGRIVSIHLEDFISFKKVSFRFGKTFNLIYGSNGVGKSSILCAIFLGLGGKPKFLGRVNNLRSFIRENCVTAKIEIELLNPNGKNYVIKRVIAKDIKMKDCKSSWFLGGVPVQQKEIETLVSRLNIQVDNLCQFLPQERVSDFSKLSAQELLENTQKCVGTAEMIACHEELKKIHVQCVELERKLSDLNSKMENEERRNRRLAVDVDKMAEKQRLLQSVKKMKQKRAWLSYSNMKTKLEEVKDDKRKATLNFKKFENTYKPLESSISSMNAKIKETEQSLNNQDQEMQKNLASVRNYQEDVETTDNQIKQNIRDCESKLQLEQQRQNEVEILRQQIDKLKNDLRTYPEEQVISVRQEMKNIVTEISTKTSSKNKLCDIMENRRNQLEIIHQNIQDTEKDLQMAKNVAKQRLQLIERKNKDVYRAIVWLRENKDKFRHTIYEPMIIELNVSDGRNAKFVESVIPGRDLYAFTCEDKGDMNKFLQEVREKLNLRVNVVHSGPEQQPLSAYKPSVHLNELRKYGFHSYLLEKFTGPEPILRYLCRMYRVHNIPIGNADISKHYEKVPDSINYFFSESQSYYILKSKYTGNKSCSISELRPPYLLTISIDYQLIQRLEKSLGELQERRTNKMNELTNIQKDIHYLENELEALRTKKKELSNILEVQRTIQAKLVAKQDMLTKMECGKIDPEAEKQKFHQENQKLTLKFFQLTQQLLVPLRRYDECSIENKILHQELGIMKEEINKKRNESQELLKKYEEAKKLLVNVDQRIKDYKEKAKILYKEATAATGGVSTVDPEFETYSEAFVLLPDTVEELDRQIQGHQAKADCLGDSDIAVMSEYEKCKNQISSLKGNLKDQEGQFNTLKQRIVTLREQWLPPLKELVLEISKKVGEYFARLNCAGEVVLSTGENEEDYSQYGLKIKVKFRDRDQMQELTHYLQSGGEKAVTTAIYFTALQELSRIPFCCVDEINQGMDATNERLIFELLGTTASEKRSQYILLTPKIIPGLSYSEDVTTLCVYETRIHRNAT